MKTPNNYTGSTTLDAISVLLDVRTPEEFNEMHAVGAINLSVQEIITQSVSAQEVLSSIPKNAHIRVHCASGGRSAVACSILSGLGFEQVEDVGGLKEAIILTSTENCYTK